jgi:hypothetical protein
MVKAKYIILAETVNGKEKRKVLVTDRGGLWGSEMSRLPHFIDNRFNEDDEVSLTLRPHFIPRNIPGTHFY